ncbi:hypothetical protein [Micromonospora sp. DT229]|uniref:hypothetical protein n=1 Tax=Micromonospora sp. DT229 TaxID=3393430 RepID=UPI003CF878F1
MHQQPTYTVTFDPMAGVGPLAVSADQMDEQIHRAFLAAEAVDVDDEFSVAIDIPAGTVVVRADGDVIEHGTVVPKSDYWLTLADDLRAAADKVATLAGTECKPPWANLSIQMADPGSQDLAAIGRVDTIAAAFGVTASTRKSAGGFYEHGASVRQGLLRVEAYGYIPEPEDPEKAALRARIAELEAQQSTGGAA